MQILTSARCARRLSNKVGLDEANVVAGGVVEVGYCPLSPGDDCG